MAVMVWVGKMLSLWAVAVAVVVEAISINGFDACAWPRRGLGLGLSLGVPAPRLDLVGRSILNLRLPSPRD
ncbi:hypothetical protein OsI_23574 [Oryza sativa Indica Group]|uniref:Secreted protein n=1 Tax=Oryza sativa subsp. indica TaxID=39946 RepID=A2YEN0_ORYSI|nr:hypothetical protein OsI_23574 [Oryza sativa Indica Group]